MLFIIPPWVVVFPRPGSFISFICLLRYLLVRGDCQMPGASLVTFSHRLRPNTIVASWATEFFGTFQENGLLHYHRIKYQELTLGLHLGFSLPLKISIKSPSLFKKMHLILPKRSEKIGFPLLQTVDSLVLFHFNNALGMDRG